MIWYLLEYTHGGVDLSCNICKINPPAQPDMYNVVFFEKVTRTVVLANPSLIQKL